jgi:ribose transport system permease protein
MPPFVVTLCSMTVCRGSAYLISDGKPVPVNLKEFNFLGNGYLGSIPLPVIFTVLCLVLCIILLNRTKFGKYVYALGGNRDAARYSGINIQSVEIRVYALCGVLSALAGIILAARMYSGQPTSASGYELDAIAATVIGGTSMAGGIGAVGGTFLGALIIGILYNGMNLLKTQFYFQTIAKGIVILIAVYLDMMRHKARGKREMKQQAET